MDGPTLWPIVTLGSGSKIQMSANIDRRTAKTSSACIKIEIGKNNTLSQLIELATRAFPYLGLAQKDSPSPSP